jgi:hypothetical protein
MDSQKKNHRDGTSINQTSPSPHGRHNYANLVVRFSDCGMNPIYVNLKYSDLGLRSRCYLVQGKFSARPLLYMSISKNFLIFAFVCSGAWSKKCNYCHFRDGTTIKSLGCSHCQCLLPKLKKIASLSGYIRRRVQTNHHMLMKTNDWIVQCMIQPVVC